MLLRTDILHWVPLIKIRSFLKTWFSLAHKHKHKEIRTRRMVYLTQFSIPALLNTMINKMANNCNMAPYCFWYVRMRSCSKWPTIGPRPCAYACAYADPVLTSPSHDISISTSTRRTHLSVFLEFMLLLMSTQFSLAYTCASAYFYFYFLQFLLKKRQVLQCYLRININ